MAEMVLPPILVMSVLRSDNGRELEGFVDCASIWKQMRGYLYASVLRTVQLADMVRVCYIAL